MFVMEIYLYCQVTESSVVVDVSGIPLCSGVTFVIFSMSRNMCSSGALLLRQ